MAQRKLGKLNSDIPDTCGILAWLRKRRTARHIKAFPSFICGYLPEYPLTRSHFRVTGSFSQALS